MRRLETIFARLRAVRKKKKKRAWLGVINAETRGDRRAGAFLFSWRVFIVAFQAAAATNLQNWANACARIHRMQFNIAAVGHTYGRTRAPPEDRFAYRQLVRIHLH